MPPYHSVAGNVITIYLDVEDDPPGPLDTPYRSFLSQIAVEWGAIANAMDLKLRIAPGEKTVLLDNTQPSPPGTALVDTAAPTDRILYFNSVVDPPSSNIKTFSLKIGDGAAADSQSQSTKTSYTKYEKGEGYIYIEAGGAVTSISHELGHILGLQDRYYEAMYWDKKNVIDRTCKQIREGEWFESGVDQRSPVPDTTPATHRLPHYAERVSLVMHQRAVPEDTAYQPDNNLMSSSSAVITPYQLEFIGIKPDGQNQNPKEEPKIRKTKWVAILGNKDNTNLKEFWTWEETDRNNRGLKYFPNNDPSKPQASYPGWSRSRGRALDKGDIVRELLITEVMGKKDGWILFLKSVLKDEREFKVVKNRFQARNPRMCFAKHVILDLATE